MDHELLPEEAAAEKEVKHPHVEAESKKHDAGTFKSGEVPAVSNKAHGHAAPTASERAFDAHPAKAPREHQPTSAEIMRQESEVDGPAIEAASRLYDIPTAVIRAIITQESRGDANANAGLTQKNHGEHAASGLMQVTEESWKQAQHEYAELSGFDFETYRYDRATNIVVGTAILAAKQRALIRAGIPKTAHIAMLSAMAYNAGEGLIETAYRFAKNAGSKQPDTDCILPEYLKPAIAQSPEVYGYYLSGAGKYRNKAVSHEDRVAQAVELKYEEISRYPHAINALLARDAKDAKDEAAKTGDAETHAGPAKVAEAKDPKAAAGPHHE